MGRLFAAAMPITSKVLLGLAGKSELRDAKDF
jgi:hypothetical protein